MGILVKLLKRTPIYTVLLTCLLAVGIAFSSISFAFYQAARQQLAEIDAGYTTAAIPYNADAHGYMPMEPGENIFIRRQVSMEELLEDTLVDYQLDRRVYLGAVVDGMDSLTPASNMLYYTFEADCPYSASVFAVRCEDVQTTENKQYVETYDADGNSLGTETTVSTSYHYTFSVLKSVCFMDRGSAAKEYVDTETGSVRSTALPPEWLEVDTEIVNPDCTPAFEAGKTYLIRGDCPLDTIGTGRSSFSLENGVVSSGTEELTVDGTTCTVVSGGVLPLYTEFSGSVDDFLNSEEGALWRDTIIPAIEQNYHSAKLMLSDNISSMYWFNTGEASILEGRLFTDAEYQDGESVCLVSASYAELNGLSVGDTLTMDLYHPNIGALRSMGEEDGTCMMIDPCMPENSLDLRMEYTIVGIYTAPSYANGTYAFGPDTILAPKASVTGVEDFEDAGTYIPLLNSAMIANGSVEKLNAFLEEKGFSGSLLYFDQGYTEASAAVSTLLSNALRLFAAGCVFLVITAGLFLFLCMHKMRPTVISLRRMGISGKACWHEMQLAVVPMVLAAVLLGVGLCVLAFDQVGNMMLSAQMELPLPSTLAYNAINLFLLLLLEGVCARRLTKVNLMQTGK